MDTKDKQLIELLQYSKQILPHSSTPRPPFEARDVPQLYIKLLETSRQLEDFHRNSFIYGLLNSERRYYRPFTSQEIFKRIINGISHMQGFRYSMYINTEMEYRDALKGRITPRDYEQYVDRYIRLIKMKNETNGQNLEPIPFPFHDYDYAPGSYEDKLHKLNKFVINIFDTLNTLYKMEEQVIIDNIEYQGMLPKLELFFRRGIEMNEIKVLYKKIGDGYINGIDEYELLNELYEKYQKIQMQIQRFNWRVREREEYE